jgi:nicotinamidase-related amidase
MIRSLIRSRRRQVLIDINTQRDFFLAEGNACTTNHRRVLANVRRVMAWARSKNIPVISTCEVYPNDNGSSTVNYCLDGTPGQRKLSYSLLPNRINFPADGSTDIPRDLLRRYSQVILHKRSVDPFTEPRIDRLLTELKASEFILIGATAEGAVMATALGLMQRGKTVTIVSDAVGSSDKKEAHLALRKAKAKGANLIETRKLAGKSHLRLVGACGCKVCHKQAEKPKAKFVANF